ncbi:unnamed protein product [Protopolystoma xenopodis]|uniref:Uncharacterized protein n=1 Tax=Protopolystoma xenopodis TaxID=117903 RepID=A0A448WWP7_9PLAT|nr:unnamed protein product [Protopolystoma xenopodis]
MLLPQRVLVRLPACPALPLSDYKFRSETAEDVVTRIILFCLPLGTLPSPSSSTYNSSVSGCAASNYSLSRLGSASEEDEDEGQEEYDDESGLIFGRPVKPSKRRQLSSPPLDDLILPGSGSAHFGFTVDSGLGASPVGSVLGDTIDVNCLDTGLEKLPEAL